MKKLPTLLLALALFALTSCAGTAPSLTFTPSNGGWAVTAGYVFPAK